MAQTWTQEQLIQLRDNLNKYFSDDDLRDLCFMLKACRGMEDLDYASLPGEGRSAKARELVAYVERHNGIPALVKQCRKLRPKVDWPGGSVFLPPPEMPIPAQGVNWLAITVATSVIVVAAIIIVVAYVQYYLPHQVSIIAAQTAEARLTSIALSATPTPSATCTATPTGTLTPTPPTASLLPASAREKLVLDVWQALEQGNYSLAVTKADECISGFAALAFTAQADLYNSGSPTPVTGKASDEKTKNDILARGALNDVAACYFAKGRALELSKRVDDARAAYEMTQQLPDARVWDPANDTFWSPAQAATEQFAILSPSTSPSIWAVYTDSLGSFVHMLPVPGKAEAIALDFDVKENGWVIVTKGLRLVSTSGTGKIRFSYRGSGMTNTLELKLFYGPDYMGRTPIFGALWPQATVTSDWVTLEVPFTKFSCWAETGCRADDKLDPRRVRKMDFAISNKQGDTRGKGNVIISDVQEIK